MFTIITDFLKANQIYVFIGVFVLLLGWHFLAVKKAVEANDATWVQRIKDAPEKIKIVTDTVFVQKPNIGGSGIGVSHPDARIDTLIATIVNKDSLIRSLATPKTMDTSVADLGKLSLGYVPLGNYFTWSLTNRPPVPITTVTITKEKMILVPFRTLAVSADLNPVGQGYAGLKYRVSDYWIIGTSYKILGADLGTKWTDNLRLQIDYYFY